MSKFKWTQENENGYVTIAHAADLRADENEKRRILQDLGRALKHPGLDTEYPKNNNSIPYVRGAVSDDDFTIEVPSGKVVKLKFGENILYFKQDGDAKWSKDGSTYHKFISNLSELEDVEITSPSGGQVLTYDGSLNKWKNV